MKKYIAYLLLIFSLCLFINEGELHNPPPRLVIYGDVKVWYCASIKQDYMDLIEINLDKSTHYADYAKREMFKYPDTQPLFIIP